VFAGKTVGQVAAVSPEEAKELYETYAVPAPGAPLFQAATANLNPWTEVKVDTDNPERGPLLIISGEKDHTVPWSLSNAAYKQQKDNPGITEIVSVDGRGHALTIDSGWRQVAETALAFADRALQQVGRSGWGGGDVPCFVLKRLRRRRRERGAHRVGAQVAERPQERTGGGERLAVLLARPLGLVARLDEVRQRVVPSVQAARAHHDRAHALLDRVIAQFVGERRELTELEHVVDRHLVVAIALRRDDLDRVGGGGDLLLAKIEHGQHDGFTVEACRDVDACVLHI
jgi:hypothetical protein